MALRAVFLDAMGTLVALREPWPAFRRALVERLGIEVDLATAESALRAEMAYYRAHCREGADPDSLRRLRLRCAEVARAELGDDSLPLPDLVDALLSALRFEPHPDAAPALEALRVRGLDLVVVSNWDCSLAAVLEELGLTGFLGVVTSAGAGASKPDRAIFANALELAGRAPGEVLHVGDSPEDDVAGARAAGLHAILCRRPGPGLEGAVAEADRLLGEGPS